MLASQQLVNFLSFLAIQQTRANNASLFIPFSFSLSILCPRCSPPRRQPATSDAADEPDRNNTTTIRCSQHLHSVAISGRYFPLSLFAFARAPPAKQPAHALFAAKSTSPAADRSQHGSALCSPLADLLRTEASSVALGTHNFPLVI